MPFLTARIISVKKFILSLLALSLAAGSATAAESDTRWHVVLAAVGNEQHVFDSFITDFGETIKDSPHVASFTELHASVDERWQPSGLRDLESSLAALNPAEDEGCLIYLTGHGAPEGLAMSADTPTMFVRPTRMESMLNTCANRKTVLVVSACFSGMYLRPGITRPERIVMTASAEDLTSFGCSNNNRYTFFDQCFLDAWPRQTQWGMLADEVKDCVRETERSNGFPSSKPQFFFGVGLRELALPGPAS
jgi:hypothetical protein